jgi:hypothetical protein
MRSEKINGGLYHWEVGLSLLILIFILLINHLFGFFGHYGYDDLYYAAISQQVLAHTFSLGNDHYNYRWVVIFLTAIAYRLFGINDHASAVMPILFTMLTAYLVAKCVVDKWQACLAVFLFGLYSWTLFYADKIMPDIYVAFFFFAAIYMIYKQQSGTNKSLLYGFLVALSLLLAFLSKETILLTAPIFFYLFMADLLQGRNQKFWIAAILSEFLSLALYFVFIRIETGSFFQRFYAINNESYFNPCSYDLLPISETIRRVGWGLWLVFIRSGLFLLIIFAAAAIIKRPLKGMIKISSPNDFFPAVMILGLLCANFMSTSPLHYVPMCDDPRHYLFLIPVAAVVASKGGLLFFDNPKPFFWLPVLLLIVLVIAYNQHFENPWLTYFPVFIITTASVLASFAGINFMLVGCIALFAVLFAQPVQSFLYARQAGYRFQKQLVKNNLLNLKEDAWVITNEVERNYGNYYLAFDTSHIVFKSFNDIKTQPVPQDKKVYLLLDGFSNMMSGKGWEDLPNYAKQTKFYQLIDSKGGAELYRIKPEDLK